MERQLGQLGGALTVDAGCLPHEVRLVPGEGVERRVDASHWATYTGILLRC